MKGVMIFLIKGKLSPWYVGHFEIVKRARKVAYELKLPREIAPVHPIFHVSLLKKLKGDPIFIHPFEWLGANEDLASEEVPIEILDLQVKQLRNK